MDIDRMLPLSRRLVSLMAAGQQWHKADLAVVLGVEAKAVDALLVALMQTESGFEMADGKVSLPKGVELLNEKLIQTELSDAVAGSLNRLEVAGVVSSTNGVLLADADGAWPVVSVLLAEGQSAGRGRIGRRWHSPLGTHVYLSVVFRWTKPLTALSGFTPALGVGMARALGQWGAEGIKVKWPNDLFYEDAKIAGVLVETRTLSAYEHRVVVGVGVNVGPESLGYDVGQAHTTVSAVAKKHLSRNRVASLIIDAVVRTFEEFNRFGLGRFFGRWRELDYFADRSVRAIGPTGIIEGVCRGLTRDGAMLLESGGVTIAVTAGEVSLRATGDATS